MLDILYILSHRPDNRYGKRFEALSAFHQRVLFWNKRAAECTNKPETWEEINIPADQTNPLKRLPETIKFIKRAQKRAIDLNPRLIYVGNLDMLYVAISVKRRFPNTKIFYEVADLHRLIADEQRGVKKIIRHFLIRAEKCFCKKIDKLVLTSPKFYDFYYSSFVEEPKVIYMPNLPIASAFACYTPVARKNAPFTIGFFGWVRYLDQLNMLLDASERLGFNVLIAGSDNSGNEFRDRCSSMSNVEYYGPFDYKKDIAALYQRVDCIYSVYDAGLSNVRIALPNKLYEAILAKKPILVAKDTYLSELVKQYGIGLAVKHDDVNSLINAVELLSCNSAKYAECVECCTKIGHIVNQEKYDRILLDSVCKELGAE